MLFKLILTLFLASHFSAANKLSPAKKNIFSNTDCDSIHAPLTNCAYYIFISQEFITSECAEKHTIEQFANYFLQNISSDGANVWGIRDFGGGSSQAWCNVRSRGNKADFQYLLDQFLNFPGCIVTPGDASFTDPLQDLLNITQVFPNIAVFFQGDTTTISDLSNAMSLAQQIANNYPLIYVWDISVTGDTTGLFTTLTGNQPGRIIRSSNDLNSLISIANQQLFGDFVNVGCGSSPFTQATPTAASTTPTIASTAFTSKPTQSSSNNNCVSLDLIFILDRSESVIPNFYNNNVTDFVIQVANQFTFFDEASPNNPAFARYGIIQFADDAIVTLPLSNYSRNNFYTQVYNSTSYGDGGISSLADAFNVAYNQFKQNSIFDNRVIVLVVNDVSMSTIKASRDALHRLQNYVNLPIGVITPGSWGNQQESLEHLKILLDNKTQFAFPSLDAAESGIPSLIDSTYPCTEPPACSALIFIEESSEAIGQDSKVQFLRLAQQIASATKHNSNQRFGLALYAQEVYKKIELLNFAEFNKTITDFINVMTDANFPNGGKTYLQPILSNLQTVINAGLYKNYAVLLMGEMEAVKDVGQAVPIVNSIATLGANIYVIDESNIATTLWSTLTNKAPGHVLNGNGATQSSLFTNLSKTLIPEFDAMSC